MKKLGSSAKLKRKEKTANGEKKQLRVAKSTITIIKNTEREKENELHT